MRPFMFTVLPAALAVLVAPGRPLFEKFGCKNDYLVAAFSKYQQQDISLKKVMHCPSETGSHCVHGQCSATKPVDVALNFPLHRQRLYNKPSGHYLNPKISLSDVPETTGNDQCLHNSPSDKDPVQGIVRCRDQFGLQDCKLVETCSGNTPKCVRLAFDTSPNSDKLLHTRELRRSTFAFCMSSDTAEMFSNQFELPEYQELVNTQTELVDYSGEFGMECGHDRCVFM